MIAQHYERIPLSVSGRGWRRGSDLRILMLLLAGANLHLITGNFDTALIFLPKEAMSGQWWRFLTHPFVHLSWYHLVLDASAFFILYSELREKPLWVRLLSLFICGAFSLMFVLWLAPGIESYGLCGLSGIAHGLMVISAMEMTEKHDTLRLGIFSLTILIAKSIYESITGTVWFEFLYFGLCGTPIIACHTGGMAGGFIAYLLTRGDEGNHLFERS